MAEAAATGAEWAAAAIATAERVFSSGSALKGPIRKSRLMEPRGGCVPFRGQVYESALGLPSLGGDAAERRGDVADFADPASAGRRQIRTVGAWPWRSSR